MEVFSERQPQGRGGGAVRRLIESSQNAGRSETLSPDDVLRAIINASGPDEDSSVITVTFSSRPTAALTTGQTFRVRGVIQWGSGGFQHEAEIDLAHGSIISVAASWIRCSAANEGTGASVIVGATIGYMPRAGGHQARRTRYQPSLDADNMYAYVVPSFATTFTFMRGESWVPFAIQLLENEVDDNILGEYVIAAGEQAPQGIPLPNNCRRVRIIPNPVSTIEGASGFDGQPSCCIFDLVL